MSASVRQPPSSSLTLSWLSMSSMPWTVRASLSAARLWLKLPTVPRRIAVPSTAVTAISDASGIRGSRMSESRIASSRLESIEMTIPFGSLSQGHSHPATV